jgi:hypothetical protein
MCETDRFTAGFTVNHFGAAFAGGGVLLHFVGSKLGCQSAEYGGSELLLAAGDASSYNSVAASFQTAAE